MAIETCKLCLGRGKIMGMGTIMQDCPDCKGVGKVDVPDSAADADKSIDKAKEEVTEQVIAKPVIKRRMGRAARIKVEG